MRGREWLESRMRWRVAPREDLVEGVASADRECSGRTCVDEDGPGRRDGVSAGAAGDDIFDRREAALRICSTCSSSLDENSRSKYSSLSSSLRRFGGRRIGVTGSLPSAGTGGVEGLSAGGCSCWPPRRTSSLAGREGDSSPSMSITSPRPVVGVSWPGGSPFCSRGRRYFRILWSFLGRGVVVAAPPPSPCAAARSSASSAQKKKSQPSTLSGQE